MLKELDNKKRYKTVITIKQTCRSRAEDSATTAAAAGIYFINKGSV